MHGEHESQPKCPRSGTPARSAPTRRPPARPQPGARLRLATGLAAAAIPPAARRRRRVSRAAVPDASPVTAIGNGLRPGSGREARSGTEPEVAVRARAPPDPGRGRARDFAPALRQTQKPRETTTDDPDLRLPPPDHIDRRRAGRLRLLHEDIGPVLGEANGSVRRGGPRLSPILRISHRRDLDHHHHVPVPQAGRLRASRQQPGAHHPAVDPGGRRGFLGEPGSMRAASRPHGSRVSAPTESPSPILAASRTSSWRATATRGDRSPMRRRASAKSMASGASTAPSWPSWTAPRWTTS